MNNCGRSNIHNIWMSIIYSIHKSQYTIEKITLIHNIIHDKVTKSRYVASLFFCSSDTRLDLGNSRSGIIARLYHHITIYIWKRLYVIYYNMLMSLLVSIACVGRYKIHKTLSNKLHDCIRISMNSLYLGSYNIFNTFI